MNKDVEQTKNFRIEQSKEKLNISQLMLKKGYLNDSIVYSYLSMFYAIRVYLIEKNLDSDKDSKILELVDKYFEPSGWNNIDIVNILRESIRFKDYVEKTPGVKATKEEAEKIYQDAEIINQEMLKKHSNPLHLSK